MEKILKLQSEQGFTETAIPFAFTSSKLVDFTIPGSNGSSYDLGKSYININMEVVPHNNAAAAAANPPLFAAGLSSTPEAYNNDIGFTTDQSNGEQYVVDCATMVRNASMFSANKGMVESIRRVNTLRSVLWNFENDKGEQRDGLDKFSSFQGRRGIKNETSSLLQICGVNTNADGTVDLGRKAAALSRDFRIPLSDLFGVGSAMWNADAFGDTRIHLELEPNRLKIQQLGGSEPTSNLTQGGVAKPWGGFEPYTGAASPAQALLPAGGSLGLTQTPLISKIVYDDYGLNFPFYVGQAIQINFNKTITGGAGPTAELKYAVISELRYGNGDNAANPPASAATDNQGQMVIVTEAAIYVAGAGATESIDTILVTALKSDATNDAIRINRAELVLSEMVGVEAPPTIDYTTYSTEETQAPNGLLTYNKQIICEPNAQNLIIASVNSAEIAPDRAFTSYRLAIDNQDVCGNRDVEYNKPLHKDRIMRFFNNRGQNVSNTSLKIVNGLAGQAAQANQQSMFAILETLPLTAGSKIVNLELNAGAAVQDVIFYKELTKTI